MPIVAGGLRVVPDVVFPRAKVAVFADGCLWHRCFQHGSTPKTNAEYWEAKLDGNVDRDRRVDAALRSGGWTVVRVWEHRIAAGASGIADEVAAVLSRS